MATTQPGQPTQSGLANPYGNPYSAQVTTADPNTSGYMNIGSNGIAFGTMTPDQYTSYQLNQLTAQNSPYLQQARQAAINQATSRGIGNSSIAAGNAQGAAIQAALPIATNDANNLNQLQRTNLQDAAQQNSAFRQAEATENAAGSMASAGVQEADIRAAQSMQAQRELLAYQGEQAGLTRQFDMGTLMQNYYNQSGLSGQGYQQSAALSQQQFNNQFAMQQFQDRFNLGSSMLQNSQGFAFNAGLKAMDNPAIMGDPAAFGGYLSFLQDPYNNYIDQMFGGLYGYGS